MVIVANVKPVVGEVEFKMEKKPRVLLYLKISIDQVERTL